MLFLAIFCLLMLAAVNFIFSGKKALYPPVIFSGVWCLNLSILAFRNDLFYSISEKALVIFVLGAVALSLGSWSALASHRLCKDGPVQDVASKRFLNLFVVIILCLIPGYILWIKHLAENFDTSNILLGAKLAWGANVDMGSMGPVFNNLIPFSITVGWIAFMEAGRKRAILACSCALLINLLTGSRSGAIIFIIGLFTIDTLKRGAIRWKAALALALAFVLCFSLAAYFLQKGIDQEASLSENVSSLTESVATYVSGGAVAFGQVVDHKNAAVHNQQFYQPFAPILNLFGANIEPAIPNTDFNFVSVGPYALTNVFTIYFFYYDAGIAATMLLLFIVGAFTGLVFAQAKTGSKAATILYAFLVSGLLLSIFSEYFFVAIGNIIRIYAVAWSVYRLPGFMSRVMNRLPSALVRIPDNDSPPRQRV